MITNWTQIGLGKIVASTLIQAGFDPLQSWLTLYSDNNTTYPDECYYDSNFVSFNEAISGGAFEYSTKKSTFSLTKNAKYTLLITCGGWLDGKDWYRGCNLEYLKLLNGEKEFFNKTLGNFITRKIEIQGPVNDLHLESSLAYGGTHSNIGVIGGTMVIICKE